MNTIPVSKLIIFLGIYVVASMVTAFSIKSAEGTADFENFANDALQTQSVAIQQFETSGGVNPFEAAGPAVEVVSSGVSTLELLWKSFTLQSPIWESDWSNVVRVFLWVIAAVLALYIIMEGVRILQGFIPFT